MRKRYVQKREDGKLVMVDATDWVAPPRKTPYVMTDLKDYMPVAGPEAQKFLTRDPDRKMISGRKAHREYLKKNGLIEVGNEKKPFVEHSGKTRENHNHWNNRYYKGHKVEPSEGDWEIPDINRLEK